MKELFRCSTSYFLSPLNQDRYFDLLFVSIISAMEVSAVRVVCAYHREVCNPVKVTFLFHRGSLSWLC